MRKPNTKATKKKFTIRKVTMSELSEEDQEMLRKGMADSEAGRTTKSKQPKKPECKTCWGWGMHYDGTAPMGPIDGSDGMPTSACPECKKNPNPYRK